MLFKKKNLSIRTLGNKGLHLTYQTSIIIFLAQGKFGQIGKHEQMNITHVIRKPENTNNLFETNEREQEKKKKKRKSENKRTNNKG